MVNGSYATFYSHVVDDVSWRVMGTHPLAGHYGSKEAFYNSTSVRLSKIEQPGGTTSLVRVVGGCDEAWSVEELLGNVTMRNGMPFVNQYSWSTRWDEMGRIVEVRAYVDSALVTRVITQNEPVTDSDFMTERSVIYDGVY
jgi:ketosteroid isomerase-like protein